MREAEVSNKQIKGIEIKNKDLIIQFYFDENLLLNKQNKSLLFRLRNTDTVISFPFTQVASLNGYGVYETAVDLNIYNKDFSQKAIWDLYVQLGDTANKKKYRLKSNKQPFALVYYLFEKDNSLFTPYTTKEGGISFKTTPPYILASVDEASLQKDGTVYLSGYSFYPLHNSLQIGNIKRTLIVSNDLNEKKFRFPVKGKMRKDLTEKYGYGLNNYDNIGFETIVNIKQCLEHNRAVNLRFYLEFSFSDSDAVDHITSPRLSYQPLIHKNVQSKVWKIGKAKKKVTLKATKQRGFLTVSASVFYLNQEIQERIRKIFYKWKQANKIVVVYKILFQLVGYLPAKKKSIIFESFLGKQYSCNPRAIYEYLKEYHPEFDMYWSVDSRFIENFEEKDLMIVPRFSLKWLFKMARAEFWVSNSRLPLWIPKPKHTTYLQTWHGTPLKKLAADMDEVYMPGTSTEKYKENFLFEARNWDYLISPNAYSSKNFRSAFQFDKKVIESGYPRNDILYDHGTKDNMDELKKKFNLPLNKKVILYAPTWRDDQFYQKGKYKFDLELDLKKLKKELGNEYVVILRMHYLVAENFDLSPYKGFAYDFSNYEDIRELYLIADLLITDYSSVFFDYGNLKRPIIFYVYDIETYRDKLRGFYFDFEKTAPGPLVKTTEEVIDYIKNVDSMEFTEKYNDFYNTFCYLEDGNASSRVVKEVFLK
ncbi:CDP-glycerol glycerophosphotransferase family protein [Niallia nealsonii]|uniref:CDP-glycerol glycerophosphotransferase family protein n=1 Tax=Niallia nealsonii TaxID=115979 RepID=A0A2N0YXW1_9BACI|nr:CDP-glycerol glycerophosphotransferase family protein [Niallia nealsonii]PKG22097.1 CDP-glycerol glycerophosphotransferase family protein [Niallia nealsonii]